MQQIARLDATDSALQKSNVVSDRLTLQLKRANQTIEQQVGLLNSLQSKPQELSQMNVPALVDLSKNLVAQNERTISAALQDNEASQVVIAANSQLVTDSHGQWVILAGSAPDETSARKSVEQAKATRFPGATVIRNHGVYRTAIVYGDRQAASSALSLVKEKVRPDAYLTSMEKWCPKPPRHGERFN